MHSGHGNEKVTPGRSVTAALADAIAAQKAGDPLTPVTVLLASHTHDAPLRRALARGSNGIAAVNFTTIAELAEQIASAKLVNKNGAPLKPLDGITTAGLAQQALQADHGVFGKRHDHPATSIALARVIRELRSVSPDSLDALAKTGDRAKDLVRVHRAVEGAIGSEWFDDAHAIELATAEVAAGRASLTPIIHLLPTELTLREEQFVAALAGNTSFTTIGAELPNLPSQPLPDAHIITAADPDDEVRQVVREIASAIAEGTPAHRIAVISSAAEPYNRLLAEHLTAADIEFNGSTGRTVRELAPARFLLGLTEIDRSHVWRSELFGVLASAPVVKADGRLINTATWRGIAIDASVNGSLAHWAQRLTQVEHDKEWQNAVAQELAAFITELDAELAALEAATTWSDQIAKYHDLLTRYLDHKTLGDAGRAALAELRRVLNSFAAFDELGVSAARGRLNELLEIETGSRQLSHGKSGIGVRLIVLAQASGLDADLVIAVGCVEGMLPHRPPVEPLLHPDERELLAGRGERIRTSADVTARQHESFRYAVAAAPKIILTLPRGDLRKTASRQPSRWVLEIAAQLIGAPEGETFGPKQLLAHKEDGLGCVRNVGSFVSGLARLTAPATEQDYRIRASEQTDPLESPDELLARNAELRHARRSREFTRFDGNLAVAENILGETFWLSASSLENYLSCPHRFFMEKVLKIKRDGLDEEGVFTPAYKGSFIHAVLAAHLGDGQDLRDAFEAKEAEDVDAGLTGSSVEWSIEREPLYELIVQMAERERAWMAARGVEVATTEDEFLVPFADGLLLHGYIDRLDLGAGGSIHITDYKGKRNAAFKGITPEDPHAGNRKVQLTLYALAAQKMDISRADAELPVETRYTFYGEESTDDDLTLTLTPSQLEAASELIEWVVDAARDGIFPAYVQPGLETNYCPFCDAEGSGAGHVRRDFERKRMAPEIKRWLTLATWASELEEAE